MTAPKIITVHTYPPIPIRSCDWHAWYDGYEESGPVGEGATEQAAIDDLLNNYDVPEVDNG